MRVLIIDDDPEELELFEHAAAALNTRIEFIEALDCNGSIQVINAQVPDFIIIDIHLGPQSGIDCLKQLRATQAGETIPIVMYSTSGSPQHIETCFNEKANYFFTKPNSIRDIGEVLKTLISLDWKAKPPASRETFVIHVTNRIT